MYTINIRIDWKTIFERMEMTFIPENHEKPHGVLAGPLFWEDLHWKMTSTQLLEDFPLTAWMIVRVWWFFGDGSLVLQQKYKKICQK